MAGSGPERKKVVLPKNLASKAKAKTPSSGKDRGDDLTNPYTTIIRESIESLRQRGQIIAALRQLADVDALTSNAVNSFVSLALSGGWRIRAMETSTHRYSPEGTDLAYRVMASFDTIYDYTKKYQDKPSTSALLETFLKDLLLTGGIGAELVLDEQRLPNRIQPIDYSTITWKANGKGGRYPSQKASGEPVELNYATIWFEEMQKDSSKAYAAPMLYSSLNSSFILQDYIEDMQKVLKKSGHSRLVASLIAEKIANSAPEDVKEDPAKLASYMNEVKDNVTSTLRNLEPDEAVIAFDSVEFENHENRSTKAEYTPLLQALGNFAATGLKTPSSILGLRISGSQALSNSETATFTRQVTGLQAPVARLLSRVLTLAARLYGADVYCQFVLNEPDMRTASESSAFETMRQARVLEQLSIGMLSDEEAAWELGRVLPDGYTPLSGTFFMDTGSTDTSSTTAPNQNAGAMNQQLASSKAPKAAGGKSK